MIANTECLYIRYLHSLSDETPLKMIEPEHKKKN